MSDGGQVRRLAGLTGVCLGLIGIFASLTLTAQGRPGWAVSFACTGIIVTLLGLRLLPPPGPD